MLDGKLHLQQGGGVKRKKKRKKKAKEVKPKSSCSSASVFLRTWDKNAKRSGERNSQDESLKRECILGFCTCPAFLAKT